MVIKEYGYEYPRPRRWRMGQGTNQHNAARQHRPSFDDDSGCKEEYTLEHQMPEVPLAAGEVVYTREDDILQVYIGTMPEIQALREAEVKIEVHESWPRMEEAANNQGFYGFRVLAA